MADAKVEMLKSESGDKNDLKMLNHMTSSKSDSDLSTSSVSTDSKSKDDSKWYKFPVARCKNAGKVANGNKDGASANIKSETVCYSTLVVDYFMKMVSVVLMLYSIYSLFSVVAWVSHLGARVPFMQKVLIAKGYASNAPVKDIYELFKYNMVTACFFVLPHSLLRPPTLKKYVGYRYARLIYCAIAGLSCHLLILYFRPINFNVKYQKCFETQADTDYCSRYVYDESENVPLFTLPVPKFVHDFLSLSMLIFSLYCFMIDYRTYVILGFNRAFFGPNSKYDRFPKDLSPRMDIITWLGYSVWLKAGSLGFVLFSGLSILPYKVYNWDIIVRVVAASYLRVRSQGFRIWVGKIESTHHFIWLLRGLIVVLAVFSQRHILEANPENDSHNTVIKATQLIGACCVVGLLMHVLEKFKY